MNRRQSAVCVCVRAECVLTNISRLNMCGAHDYIARANVACPAHRAATGRRNSTCPSPSVRVFARREAHMDLRDMRRTRKYVHTHTRKTHINSTADWRSRQEGGKRNVCDRATRAHIFVQYVFGEMRSGRANISIKCVCGRRRDAVLCKRINMLIKDAEI